jgi:ABC-type protease/lipase transport system fused ATPase/permease subunit
MDIVTYMMHVVIYMMHVMDIVIYMSCIWFLGIFGREKQKKNKKKLGKFAVRRGAGARQIDLKGLPE